MNADTATDFGLKFGPYFLFGEVSGGQTIEVWVAGEQLPSGERRSCVVKRINPRYSDFVALRELIDREVRTCTQINHPGLIKVLGHGEIDKLPYVCLEFVDGVALSQLGRLISSPAFPIGPLLELGLRVSDALSYAHELSSPLVHARLSPSNILLTREGGVKIADLGLASAAIDQPQASLIPNATQLGYLAPEQQRSDVFAPAVDVFALGVILTELACGRRLFPEGVGVVEDQAALVQRLCSKAAFAKLPDSLTALLVKMTAFDPELRPHSLQAVIDELKVIGLSHSSNDSIASYLAQNVFVQLPVLTELNPTSPNLEFLTEGLELADPPADASQVNLKDALLGAARAPSARFTAPAVASFPTTAALLLNEVVYDQSVEFEALPRLPSAALSPLVPQYISDPREPTIPPLSVAPPAPTSAEELEPGTYRIQDGGLDFLLQYDPYLRAINLTEGQVQSAKDPEQWEYYCKFGDDVGPRIIRKSLTSRIYLEQELILLEGSELFTHSFNKLLQDAMYLPRGAVVTRGESVIVDMSDDQSLEMFLKTHEMRRPRPSMRPRSEQDIKNRLFRFFGQNG